MYKDDKKKNMPEKEIQDLRYLLEFRMIPGFLHNSAEAFLGDLLANKSIMMAFLYHSQAKPHESPYLPVDFVLDDPIKLDGLNCLVIHMPEQYIRMPLCRRVYILWSDRYDSVYYFTVEMSMDGNILGCVEADGSHANYGEVRAEDEIRRILLYVSDGRR